MHCESVAPCTHSGQRRRGGRLNGSHAVSLQKVGMREGGLFSSSNTYNQPKMVRQHGHFLSPLEVGNGATWRKITCLDAPPSNTAISPPALCKAAPLLLSILRSCETPDCGDTEFRGHELE